MLLSAAIALTLLVVVSRADQVNWVPWQALPQPRSSGQAVRLNAHVFLIGGVKQLGSFSVVPALDILVINANYFFAWNTVPNLALPFSILGKSFAVGITRQGPLWRTTLYPIFVSYACADTDREVSAVVAVLTMNTENDATAVGSVETHTSNIPRRRATLASFTLVTQTDGIEAKSLANTVEVSTVFIFGGVDEMGEFVSVPEFHIAIAPNASSASAKPIWQLMRNPMMWMPKPWCLCGAAQAQDSIILSGCVDCATMQPVEGTLRYIPLSQEWVVNVPPQTATPPPYSPFFPALPGTAPSMMMNQFIATYVQHAPPTTETAEIVLYDLVLKQQNLVATTSIQARRTQSFIFTIGALMYSVGGMLVRPTATNGTLTALSDQVQMYPQVSGDLDQKSRTYYVGDTIEIYTGAACAELSSSMMLATDSDCQNLLVGTSIVPCTDPVKFDTSDIVIPKGQSIAVYVCHSWGVCIADVSQRQPCGGNFTDDDCRWAHCCWDNEAQQCFAFSDIAASTDPHAIFFNPIEISQDNLPLVPVILSNRPPPPVVHYWYESTPFIAGFAVGGVLISYFVIAYVFKSRKMRVPRGDPSNVFVAFGKKYSILKQIGQGSFGTVFLAERSPDGKQVALKCIPYTTSKQRNAALAEYDTIHKLSHPNLIKVYDLILNWDAHSDPLMRKKRSGMGPRTGSNNSVNSGSGGSPTPDNRSLNRPLLDHDVNPPEAAVLHIPPAGSGQSNGNHTPREQETKLRSNPMRSPTPYGATSGSQGSSGRSRASAEEEASFAYEELTHQTSFVCLVQPYYPQGDLRSFVSTFQRRRRLPAVGCAAVDDRLIPLAADESGFVYIPECYVLSVMRQVAQLLEYLHSRNPPVIHRDLKCENILVDGDRVVVTDFGLAHIQEDEYARTQAATLFFASPESFSRRYTTAVDLWGLGCTVYAMCTQRVEPEVARIMFSDVDEPDFEESIRHDLRHYSVGLQDLVMGMLAKNPSKRLCSTTVLKRLAKLEREGAVIGYATNT